MKPKLLIARAILILFGAALVGLVLTGLAVMIWERPVFMLTPFAAAGVLMWAIYHSFKN